MSTLEDLRNRLPEAARDIRLNLQAVLQPGVLSPAQRWGVAIASALATRNLELSAAVIREAAGQVDAAVVEDARAAAVLMAMNNVYYRFRHMVGKPAYAEKPARLRMNRMAQPAAGKLDFELMALAVSALNGRAQRGPRQRRRAPGGHPPGRGGRPGDGAGLKPPTRPGRSLRPRR